jgi:beta-fructofuranosidase
MSLRLADKWVWDFWFVHHGGQHHAFYLQAPRSLGDAGRRHHNATIGHAVTDNFRDWQVLADALHPGPPGSWDDLATWTGSAIGHEGRWYMLYTGINRSEHGLVQRVGLAHSDDLVHWLKDPHNPVLEADPRWYERLGQGRWPDQSWRDPWLFRDPQDQLFHVLLTARSGSAAPDGAGVIAHATSFDLLDWEILAPLTEPGEFAQVEVPQLVETGHGYLILFSCHAEDHSRQRLQRLGTCGRGGTFTMWAERLCGPWRSSDSPVDTPGAPGLGPLYAGKLVPGDDGQWGYMAFHGDDDRHFLGEIMGPYPADLVPDQARLIVTAASSSLDVCTINPDKEPRHEKR